MRKTTGRRPDLTQDDLEERKIWVDMACSAEANIEDERLEKLQNYQA
jgi:hypothetical protein